MNTVSKKKTCSRHFFLHSNNFSRSAHLGFSVVIIEIHIFRHHKLTNTYIFPLPKVFRTLMVVKISYHRLTGIVVDSVSNFAIIRKSHCHLKKSKLSKLGSLSSKASNFVCLDWHCRRQPLKMFHNFTIIQKVLVKSMIITSWSAWRCR